jgi:hypothetical protein
MISAVVILESAQIAAGDLQLSFPELCEFFTLCAKNTELLNTRASGACKYHFV